MKNAKMTILVFCIFVFLLPGLLSGCTSNVESVPRLEEIELPTDLNFSVNTTCSKHKTFNQAVADETGIFATDSTPLEPEDVFSDKPALAYIDIYNADGSFMKEICFTTDYSFFIELTSEYLNIYFYNNVLVYNIYTDELDNYSTPEGLATDGGLLTSLSKKSFTSGQWTYTCKRGVGGYTKLFRDDGENDQLIVEMPGTVDHLTSIVIPGIIMGVFICSVPPIFLYFILKKRKRKNKKTEDGSLS